MSPCYSTVQMMRKLDGSWQMTVEYCQVNQVVVSIAAAMWYVVYALRQVTGYKVCGYYSGKYVIFNTHQEGGSEAVCIHVDEQQQSWSCLNVV